MMDERIGGVSRELNVISNPKNILLSTEKKLKLSTFHINYHPSALKLSISASGQGQIRLESRIKT